VFPLLCCGRESQEGACRGGQCAVTRETRAEADMKLPTYESAIFKCTFEGSGRITRQKWTVRYLLPSWWATYSQAYQRSEYAGGVCHVAHGESGQKEPPHPVASNSTNMRMCPYPAYCYATPLSIRMKVIRAYFISYILKNKYPCFWGK
jgi:hypothetical protein